MLRREIRNHCKALIFISLGRPHLLVFNDNFLFLFCDQGTLLMDHIWLQDWMQMGYTVTKTILHHVYDFCNYFCKCFTGVKWHSIVFILISWWLNDWEHIFRYLLAMCIFSLSNFFNLISLLNISLVFVATGVDVAEWILFLRWKKLIHKNFCEKWSQKYSQ